MSSEALPGLMRLFSGSGEALSSLMRLSQVWLGSSLGLVRLLQGSHEAHTVIWRGSDMAHCTKSGKDLLLVWEGYSTDLGKCIHESGDVLPGLVRTLKGVDGVLPVV